jgi:NTP pyrophosphatase (non-canonical NTP hydrolase)
MGKLADLKKEYSKIEKKYSLPSYAEINNEFDIEKVAEQETETLLREVRKVMIDKVIAYLRFIEMMLNPSNAPMFFFALLKGMDASDKKLLEELYTKLGKLEIDVLFVDNNYSEKSEADFIKKVFKEWKQIKDGMNKIHGSLEKCWDKKCETKEKSYLG